MYFGDLRPGGASNAVIMRWDSGIRQPDSYRTGHRVLFVWADGTGRQNLSQEPFGDDQEVDDWGWIVPSPKGQQVAVGFWDGPTQQVLALVSPDDGQALRIWHDEREAFDWPIWSPDGSMLVFLQKGDKDAVH